MKAPEADHEEAGLRRRFAALRDSDRTLAPSFDALLHRPRASSMGLAWSAVAAAGVATVVIGAMAWVRPTAPPDLAALPEAMFSVAAEMPSDFLLEPPRHDVRRDAPRMTRADNVEVPFL